MVGICFGYFCKDIIQQESISVGCVLPAFVLSYGGRGVSLKKRPPGQRTVYPTWRETPWKNTLSLDRYSYLTGYLPLDRYPTPNRYPHDRDPPGKRPPWTEGPPRTEWPPWTEILPWTTNTPQWTESHTCVKTLPSRNFVVGGKYWSIRRISDACTSNPCYYGGTCSVDGAEYTCACYNNRFTGSQCQIIDGGKLFEKIYTCNAQFKIQDEREKSYFCVWISQDSLLETKIKSSQ